MEKEALDNLLTLPTPRNEPRISRITRREPKD